MNSSREPLNPMFNNQPLMFKNNKGKPPTTFTFGSDDGCNDEGVSSSTALSSKDSDAMAAASGTSTFWTNGQYNLAHLANANLDMMMSDSAVSHDVMPVMAPMNAMASNMVIGAYGGIVSQMDAMSVMMGQSGSHNLGMAMSSVGAFSPQLKEVITLNTCVLLPPRPDAPPHSLRERPPGCRTAFVGGLPDNISEAILQEVFEKSGPIESIRLGSKHFAHIRFLTRHSVEEATYLSGYRMKICNKDDKPNTGRLHVDYANARDDQYEYECEQRLLAREMRHFQLQQHQQNAHLERLQPSSPPALSPFTIYDGNALLEAIKTDTGMMQACRQLFAWLERGSVDKRSAGLFYSLVQSCNGHVRRLLLEKQQQEHELNQARVSYKQCVQELILQLGQVENVLSATKKQRNWDHFSKAQRKNIESWHKHVMDIRQLQQAEFLNDRNEDEMELSDSEVDEKETASLKEHLDEVISLEVPHVAFLKEENESLRYQVQAYVNEVQIMKAEMLKKEEMFKVQVKALQNSLSAMQQKLLSEATAHFLRPSSDTALSLDGGTGHISDRQDGGDSAVEPCTAAGQESDIINSSGVFLTEKEARMMGLIACFLNVHPQGATVDYIWSYLTQLVPLVKQREVEDVIGRFPSLFQQVVSGVGASLERRCSFVGYRGQALAVPG